MKRLIYGSALVLAVLLSLPATSDAFSRRSGSTELGPQTAPVQATTGTYTMVLLKRSQNRRCSCS